MYDWEWVGLGKDGNTWEPLKTFLEGAPQSVKYGLRKLGGVGTFAGEARYQDLSAD